LPEFKDVQVYVGGDNGDEKLVKPNRPITVRDLLTHTSGLTYGIFGDTPVDEMYRKAEVHDRSVPLEEAVHRMAKIPLLYHPGQQWHYSRSTDVLGRLVEVTSGMTLDDFFRQRICEPLEMKDTAFYVPAEKVDRFPVNYRWDKSGSRTIADHPATSRYLEPPKSLSGGGGLVSTALDYLQFCQMLLNGGQLGNVRLLSSKTVNLMTMNHLGDAISPTEGVQLGPGSGFGLGFRVVLDASRNQRLTSVGSYGWGGMASTMFFIDPREQLIGIVMTQKFPTDLRFRDEFQTAVYQAIVDSYIVNSGNNGN
jgi:CubicO group peptidase (beta-lactamase class C family)